MKHGLKSISRRVITALAVFMLVSVSMFVCAQEKAVHENGVEQYVTVGGHQMRVVLYGDITKSGTETFFTDRQKSTLVMLPCLGITSPNLYFKPLAQQLDENFNVIVVEPLGYGLSDMASTDRNTDNINGELYEALNALGVDECVLLVHSISGVYGLNFVLDYPEMVKGFIAIDNTVYEEELAEALAMEQEYMLSGIEEFDQLRKSFDSVSDFQLAVTEDPAKYGAALPEIQGYTYPQEDLEEYIRAFVRSANENIKSEVNHMNQSLLSIKGKKFPDTLPVLVMVSADNAGNIPAWETGHRNQLNLTSGKHKICTLQGSHYIWYTNLTGVVEQINQWQAENQF